MDQNRKYGEKWNAWWIWKSSLWSLAGGTCVWVSHVSSVRVSHVSSVWLSHVSYVWVSHVSYVWVSRVSYLSESCLICTSELCLVCMSEYFSYVEWVMSHIWVSHVSYVWVSPVSYEWVLHVSYVWVSHVLHVCVWSLAGGTRIWVSHSAYVWVSHVWYVEWVMSHMHLIVFIIHILSRFSLFSNSLSHFFLHPADFAFFLHNFPLFPPFLSESND